MVVLFVPLIVSAQQKKLALPRVPVSLAGDTIRHKLVEKDSLKIYKDIRSFASRSRLTMKLYKLVFNDPQPVHVTPAAVTKSDSVKVEGDDFARYEGAVIRKVEIRTLDPFGTSVTDTVKSQTSLLKESANRLHIKSTRMTIRNQLLFRKGQELDPLALRESERLLRQSSYVREARITVYPLDESNDTVDVYITVQDRWSVAGSLGLSTGTSKLRITEKNFLGLAHQLDASFFYNIPRQENYRFSGSYVIPYIRNTYITGSAYYAHSQFDFQRGVTFSRPFYSSLAKWSYGASVLRNNTFQHFVAGDTSVIAFPLDYHKQDVWAGRSFQLLEGRSVARRSTRLITSGRFMNTGYLRRAPFGYDTLMLNQDTWFGLTSIGFSNQRFYKDIYIYKLGEAEDVPEGRLLEVTGGYERKEFSSRYYSAVSIGIGDHIARLGYFSGFVGYGNFWRSNGTAEDGVLSLDMTYFTDSWRWKRFSGRQFLFLRSSAGYERVNAEEISLSNEKALYGFPAGGLSGSRKMMCNTVSVVYLPYRFIGFRFAAIAFAGFGMIGDEGKVWDNHVYQAYGLGVLVRNDYLVFNTFMLSFGIYPNVPGKGMEYKLNPVSTYNFGFRNYLVSRPDIIPYR
jgi:hypothetical protein